MVGAKRAEPLAGVIVLIVLWTIRTMAGAPISRASKTSGQPIRNLRSVSLPAISTCQTYGAYVKALAESLAARRGSWCRAHRIEAGGQWSSQFHGYRSTVLLESKCTQEIVSAP